MAEQHKNEDILLLAIATAIFILIYFKSKAGQQTGTQPPQQQPTHYGVDGFTVSYTDIGEASLANVHSGIDGFSISYSDIGSAAVATVHSGIDNFNISYTDTGNATIAGLHSGSDSFSITYTDVGSASH